ncbi:hypothetical protein ABK040_011007 [Willaertia magna]
MLKTLSKNSSIKNVLNKQKKSHVGIQTTINQKRFISKNSLSRTVEQQANIYEKIKSCNQKGFTYAQKILFAHLATTESQTSNIVNNPNIELFKNSLNYLQFHPDRVALQDASAQTAILQFMLTGLKKTKVPTSVHCDHLIIGSKERTSLESNQEAMKDNNEVYNFLQSASRKYGIDYWKPGSGIIHQIVLENYAFPGGLMIGCDSHTPNAGGLSMIAIGVGGADAVDVMSGIPWELKTPKILGVHLKGQLSKWANPKDIILKLTGMLTVKGGTGYIIEYFGEGVSSLSCTGMATCCNMGAEVGATCSVFPYTEKMSNYLRATNRVEIANLADSYQQYLKSDLEKCQFDKVIEINLNEIEPMINGPFTPDISNSISTFSKEIEKNNWPKECSAALIGSCTNSSYQDLTCAASLAKQALNQGLKIKSDLYISPGSEQIRATMERDGIQQVFESIGGKLLSNACGPCIGQWDRTEKKGESNSIVSSFNRNFVGRNDGNSKTHHFLTSPMLVMCMAIAGRIDFNPMTDEIDLGNGKKFKFEPPTSDELPSKGFSVTQEVLNGLIEPIDGEDTEQIKVVINPKSDRLQELKPWSAWDGKDIENVPVLIKVSGKCTTDHISPAGKWLIYKGHLENISNCTLIGAVNAINQKVNCVKNIFTGKEDTVPEVAKQYQREHQTGWIVIADHNYGEGSAREHASLQPRFLGCKAIITRSFARIHETNLKKQGILPLTFVNPEDYNLIDPETDLISIRGLQELQQGSQLVLTVKDKPNIQIPLQHTLNQTQIEWFKAGSALQWIRNKLTVN